MTATITPLRSSGPLTLLVIDDDAVTRCILCDALRGAGYKVLEASSGADALTILAKMPVHLVLLDPFLCGSIDSGAVAREAAALRPPPKVILAAPPGGGSPETADLPGTDLAAAQPYAVPTILAIVRQALDR